MESSSSLDASIELAGPSVDELARNPDKCIDIIRPHIEALAADSLIGYFNDPLVTAAKVMAAMPRVRSLEAQMAQHAPTYDRSVIDLLPPAAIALADLHGRTLSADGPSNDAGKQLEDGAKTRASLHLSAAFLANKGLASASALERIQRLGNGYNDTSAAILAYIQLHFDSLGRLVERSPTTREELDAARQEAIDLASVGVSRANRDENDASLADQKRRVYHFIVTTYNKLRSVTEYLRYEAGDAETFTPSLGNKYPKRGAKPEPSEEPVAPARVPADPSVPAGPSDENPLEE